MIKLLVIADTHGAAHVEEDVHLKENISKPFDACFLLGDITNRDITFIKKNLPEGIPVYGILGNHDSFGLLEKNGIENIHGKAVGIKNKKIVAMQGSYKYKDEDAPLYTHEESIEIAKKLPAADVFITHDSAYGSYSKNGVHCGMKGIKKYLQKHPRAIHIHGHHHKNDLHQVGLFRTKSIGVFGCKIIEIYK